LGFKATLTGHQDQNRLQKCDQFPVVTVQGGTKCQWCGEIRRLALITGINEAHWDEHIASLRDGFFILLGLLLGFTVGGILPRFDQSRDLEVEEAQSIYATWLRQIFRLGTFEPTLYRVPECRRNRISY
jgi:hypothetical protein